MARRNNRAHREPSRQARQRRGRRRESPQGPQQPGLDPRALPPAGLGDFEVVTLPNGKPLMRRITDENTNRPDPTEGATP